MTATPVPRGSRASGDVNGPARDTVPGPGRADAAQGRTETRGEIRIRFRRYGKHGGRWRADFPPGNGIDSGSIESTSLDTVERMAAEIADRYGYRIMKEEPCA